jgi:hypothetical protein
LNDLNLIKFLKDIDTKHQKEKENIRSLLQEFSDLYDVSDANDIKNEQVYKNIQVFTSELIIIM